MPEPAPPSAFSAKREWLGAGLILFLFLFVNFLVAARTPTVHVDEPVFTDAAANLYFGKGFTSTMWGEDRHEFWCSQPPLYTSLLYFFFKCFGFGLFQARAANSVLAAVGGLLIWAGLRRSRLIQSPAWRLTALALILSGSVSTLTFRMIRYDVAMFLVCSLVFFACCLPAQWRSRYLWVVLASALCPFSGVPMLPYVGLLLLLQLVVYRFRNLGLLLSIGVGFGLGIGLLLLFYNHFGVLRHFLNFVHGATHNDTAPGPGPSWKARIFGNALGDDCLLTSFFGYPLSFLPMNTMFDYSAFFLFLLFVPLGWKIWHASNGPNRRLIAFILATTLIIPPVIQFAAHYWSDYRWMTYIPLAIAVPRLLELAKQSNCVPRIQRLAPAIIAFSVFLGVPFRTLASLPDWSARSVTPIEKVAARVVQPSDVVLCQCKTYYAIRPHAQLVFCSGLSAMGELRFVKDLPTNDISLICLFPTNVAQITSMVGGKWKKLPLDNIPEADALSHTRYGVDFYRRVTN